MFDKLTNKYINKPVKTLDHCIDPIRYFMQYKIKPHRKSPRRATLVRR